MFSYFYRISTTRPAWISLALSAIFLELCALFFQHVMDLAPCVMCIYERVALFGVVIAGLLGGIAPQNSSLRWIALLLWFGATAKGLQLSLLHVSYQFPDPNVLFGPTCDLFVSFPSWAPLNEWIPSVFEATGDCSKIVWQFLTLTMPQWLVVIFAAMLLVNIVVIISQFFGKKASL